MAVGRRFLHSSAPAPLIRKLAGWAESEIAVSNTQSHTVEGSNARIDSVPAAARRRPPLRRAECPLAPPRCLPRLSPGLRRSHGAVVPLPPRARLPTSRPPPLPALPARAAARRSAASPLTKLSPTQAAWSYGTWCCTHVSLRTHSLPSGLLTSLLPRPLMYLLTTCMRAWAKRKPPFLRLCTKME